MRFAIAVILVGAASACPLEQAETQCGDGTDDDEDGAQDCADADCIGAADCQRCGNGILDEGEACDTFDDRCDERCLLRLCGDGLVSAGEECDDGNLASGDGCDLRCRREPCGNTVVDEGEECDDGNRDAGDGCDERCQDEGPACGDGVVDAILDEECDDGATSDNDGCSSGCRIERCGDAIAQSFLGEECDDGNEDDGDGCASCMIEVCGDGIVQPAFEECDDGGFLFGDGCTPECRLERCGDGVIQPSRGENCEDLNDEDPTDGCHFCQLAVCGDQIVTPSAGETCDDGDSVDHDGCTNDCRLEYCGDGIHQLYLLELCDGTPGCDDSCRPTTACLGTVCYQRVDMEGLNLGGRMIDVVSDWPGVERVRQFNPLIIEPSPFFSAEPLVIDPGQVVGKLAGFADVTGDDVLDVVTLRDGIFVHAYRAPDFVFEPVVQLPEAPITANTLMALVFPFAGSVGILVSEVGAPASTRFIPDIHGSQMSIGPFGGDVTRCGENLLITGYEEAYRVEPGASPTMEPIELRDARSIVWEGLPAVVVVGPLSAGPIGVAIRSCDPGLPILHEFAIGPPNVVEVADLDGDLIDDVLTRRGGELAKVYLSTEGFADSELPARGAFRILDLDGDGLLDILVLYSGEDAVFLRQ